MVVSKYPKGVAKTEEILTTSLRIVAEKGYNRATVRELAEAAGLSKTGLLHHFGSKEELFAEILRRRDQADEERMRTGVTEGASPQLADLSRISAKVPGLVQLYTRFSAEASDPEHTAHEFFRDRYRRARERSRDVLAHLKREGRLPESIDPERAATALVALLDGMQLQWLYDPESVDMADEVEYFMSLLGVSADGERTE